MIYFDNSATTQLSAAAREAMTGAMDLYANPSSLHAEGLKARKIIDSARASVAEALGVRNLGGSQIIFTSSGSEANNTAIFGTVYAKKRRTSSRIITTDGEHPSIENALLKLESEGFEVIRIPTKEGSLDFEAYREALSVQPILVTMMMVNNETGAVYDVAKAFDIAKKMHPDTVTHCDAVQGFLKKKFSPQSIHADLVTVSAHKIHGPKGVGALYIDAQLIKAKKIVPYIIGGGQEFSFRAGTENTVGIAGFGAAARCELSAFSANVEKMRELRSYLIENLSELNVSLNIPNGECAPHVLSITLPNIKSETMLHFLSGKGICVSSGSACSSRSLKTSGALTAFGLAPTKADCTIRVSLCASNTKDEADEFISMLKQGIDTLVPIKRK
jgi:cysteine desulfurase